MVLNKYAQMSEECKPPSCIQISKNKNGYIQFFY